MTLENEFLPVHANSLHIIRNIHRWTLGQQPFLCSVCSVGCRRGQTKPDISMGTGLVSKNGERSKKPNCSLSSCFQIKIPGSWHSGKNNTVDKNTGICTPVSLVKGSVKYISEV